MLINVPLAYSFWTQKSTEELMKISLVLTPIVHSFATSSLRRTVGYKCNFCVKHNSEKKDCHWDSLNNWPKFMQVLSKCVYVHPCLYIICVLLNSFWRSDGRNTKKREVKKRMWKRHKILSFVLHTSLPPSAQSDQTILFLSEQCTIKKEGNRKEGETAKWIMMMMSRNNLPLFSVCIARALSE